MSVEDEAVGSAIRISLQGVETLIKVTGSAAVGVSKILYAIGTKIEKGKALKIGEKKLIEIASGNNSEVFTIPKEQLKTFSKAAKQYGLNYATAAVFGDKGYETVDILIPAAQANIVNHILERSNIDGVKSGETTSEKADTEKAANAKDEQKQDDALLAPEQTTVAEQFAVKTDEVEQNPSQAQTEQTTDGIPSEPTSITTNNNEQQNAVPIPINVNDDKEEKRESIMKKLTDWDQEYKKAMADAPTKAVSQLSEDVANKMKEGKSNNGR